MIFGYLSKRVQELEATAQKLRLQVSAMESALDRMRSYSGCYQAEMSRQSSALLQVRMEMRALAHAAGLEIVEPSKDLKFKKRPEAT